MGREIDRKKSQQQRVVDKVNELGDFLQEEGLVNWSVQRTGSKIVVTGTTGYGAAVKMDFCNSSSGYRSRAMSVCPKLDIDERRREAKSLRKQGMTQANIALSLGVSQKTISTDLKS